ncbi:TPA: hypothetical protein HML99_23465 [Escherichia coli]|nr:hypothetical protein [Escherichia coli]
MYLCWSGGEDFVFNNALFGVFFSPGMFVAKLLNNYEKGVTATAVKCVGAHTLAQALNAKNALLLRAVEKGKMECVVHHKSPVLSRS